MKKFFTFLFFFLFFFFSKENFVLAQGAGSSVPSTSENITYESVEKDLFPTWRGSGDQNLAKILSKITPEEKTQLNQLDDSLQNFTDTRDAKAKELDSLKQSLNDREGQIFPLQVTVNNCDASSSSSSTPDCLLAQSQLASFLSQVQDEQKKISDAETALAQMNQDISQAQKTRSDFLNRIWNSYNMPVQGVIGMNGDRNYMLRYLPRVIDILVKIVAPIMVILLVYTGVRFIYAGDQTEEVEKAKMHLISVFSGFLFVVLSYSIMKAVYFFFSS